MGAVLQVIIGLVQPPIENYQPQRHTYTSDPHTSHTCGYMLERFQLHKQPSGNHGFRDCASTQSLFKIASIEERVPSPSGYIHSLNIILGTLTNTEWPGAISTI